MILTLGERDLYLLQIETEINNKKKLLLKKKRDLDKKQKLNHFLNGVTKDYQKYYNYILNEKQQQYDAMMLLKTYLDEVIKKEKMTKHQLKNARADKRNIILEMEKITNDLKEITK